jgi:hypothetical protein
MYEKKIPQKRDSHVPLKLHCFDDSYREGDHGNPYDTHAGVYVRN